ncbi:MAG: RNA polymerase sigma factor [Acidobacteriota bacterium]
MANEEETLSPATRIETETTPPDTLAEIFGQHHGQVFAAAYRITGSAQDAEDVLQTVFLRLLRGGHTDLSPSPGAYLRRAAVNAALDIVRSRSRSRSLGLDDLDTQPAASKTVEADRRHADREIRLCLRRAVLKLSEKSAEVFAMRYLEGLGNREIAHMVGSSQTAIGVMLHRARNQVRADLGTCLGGES